METFPLKSSKNRRSLLNTFAPLVERELGTTKQKWHHTCMPSATMSHASSKTTNPSSSSLDRVLKKTTTTPSEFFPKVQQIYLSIVARGFTSKNASKQNYRIILRLHQSEAVNILKMKLLRKKAKLGGWVKWKNVQFYFLTPYFLFRSAAADVNILTSETFFVKVMRVLNF